MNRIAPLSLIIFICSFKLGCAVAEPLPPFCAVAFQYFANPPSAFINQRGERIGDDEWKSNQSYPNARCKIMLMGDAHVAKCFYNEDAPAAAALSWYRTMETNLDKCISLLPPGNRDQFRKNSRTNTQDDGTKVVTTRWKADVSGDAEYVIEIKGFAASDGSTFNVMEISYMKFRAD